MKVEEKLKKYEILFDEITEKDLITIEKLDELIELDRELHKLRIK